MQVSSVSIVGNMNRGIKVNSIQSTKNKYNNISYTGHNYARQGAITSGVAAISAFLGIANLENYRTENIGMAIVIGFLASMVGGLFGHLSNKKAEYNKNDKN